MKHLKKFENFDTKPTLVIQDQNNNYKINKTDLEGKLYSFFKEKCKIQKGDTENEMCITYEYETHNDNEPIDIANAYKYLESLPGVETVIHRVGECFEVTFDKPIEL